MARILVRFEPNGYPTMNNYALQSNHPPLVLRTETIQSASNESARSASERPFFEVQRNAHPSAFSPTDRNAHPRPIL